jgi:hypothetical protein
METLEGAARRLDLPPGYDLIALRERGDAFAHACAIAGEAGAGAFVHVGRYDLVEFAVVLEPGEPLSGARRAFYAGMHALAEAIAAYCPPERDVAFDWPGSILFDAGLVGGGRLAWPQGCGEDDVPDWLVFGAMLRAADLGGPETGLAPNSTSLVAAGFELVETQSIAESFARHLMLAFDTWGERGFRGVGEAYLERLPKAEGEKRIIDANGDLLVTAAGASRPERRAFLPALEACAWYDLARAAPRRI